MVLDCSSLYGSTKWTNSVKINSFYYHQYHNQFLFKFSSWSVYYALVKKQFLEIVTVSLSFLCFHVKKALLYQIHIWTILTLQWHVPRYLIFHKFVSKFNLHKWLFNIINFYPRPVLACGYCRYLRLCLCVRVSVCVCVKHGLVRTITHQSFELESPNV